MNLLILGSVLFSIIGTMANVDNELPFDQLKQKKLQHLEQESAKIQKIRQCLNHAKSKNAITKCEQNHLKDKSKQAQQNSTKNI